MASTHQKEKDAEKEQDSSDPLFGNKVKPYRGHSQTNNRKFYLIIITILVLLLICAIVAAIVLYTNQPQVPGSRHQKSKIIFPSLLTGAVVSDHEQCSEIGRQILNKRGTAVDAAIATLVCNGVMTPHSMGIGGGSFMIIYDKAEKKSVFIDGRETGPRLMTEDQFNEYNANIQNKVNYNARRIGVPGELRVYKTAHDIYGRLPWKALFQPTLDLMENGIVLRNATYVALVTMDKRLKQYSKILRVEFSLANFTELCVLFQSRNWEPLKAGEKYYWPKLLKTLKGIAEQGPDYLYDGPITTTVVEELQDKGSSISMADFVIDYCSVMGESLAVNYGNYTLYTIGQATGGPIVAEILNILEGFNLTKERMSTIKKQADTLHKMIESFKFAYADRQSIEDPAFGKGMKDLIQNLVSKDYAANIRTKITDMAHSDVSYYKDVLQPEIPDDMGTSHVSVLSPYGDAVSVTSTVNWYFGSLEMSNSTGIIWNNEMDDFSNSKATVNKYAPGKRPRSSMAPVIVVDRITGHVRLVVGAAGGSRIATAVAQVIAKMLWLEDSLKTVIEQKRFHHGLVTSNGKLDKLELEKGFKELNKLIVEELLKRNHTMKDAEFSTMSVIESIFVHDDNTVEAIADNRKLHRAVS